MKDELGHVNNDCFEGGGETSIKILIWTSRARLKSIDLDCVEVSLLSVLYVAAMSLSSTNLAD